MITIAEKILILGNTGSGKSTSLRNLPPENTFILGAVRKELPFRGAKKKYRLITKDNPGGNLAYAKTFGEIRKILAYVNKQEHIKTLIIDDITYLAVEQYLKAIQVEEKNKFKKFEDIGANLYNLLHHIENDLREDLTIVLMGHMQDEEGRKCFKVPGKMISGMLVVEGLFRIVLEAGRDIEGEYIFRTNSEDEHSPAKSPMGMYEEHEVPNDLAAVLEIIKKYDEEEL